MAAGIACCPSIQLPRIVQSSDEDLLSSCCPSHSSASNKDTERSNHVGPPKGAIPVAILQSNLAMNIHQFGSSHGPFSVGKINE